MKEDGRLGATDKVDCQGLTQADVGTILATGIFLAYTVTYAIAWPGRDLITGIIFESAILLAILLWRLLRRGSADVRAKNAVVSEISNALPFGRSLAKVWRWLCLSVGTSICAITLVDLCALICASTGNLSLGEAIYAHFPVSYLVTNHPALSAEVLAGMYAESGQYNKAERVYWLIYDVRKKIFGEKNEMMVALLCDFGDFYFRQRNYCLAEDWYNKSIQMSKDIHGVSGYGRPLTGLANCYRDAEQFAFADKAYASALSIRAKVFGPTSDKVLETLKEYLKLSRLEKQKDLEATISYRISEIEAVRPGKDKGYSGNSIIFMIAGFSISYVLFGNHGVLTRLATRRLQNRVKSATATPRDLQNLRLLCKYQGIKHLPTA
jgi:tetratricopeptide (TPR) repeat protein